MSIISEGVKEIAKSVQFRIDHKTLQESRIKSFIKSIGTKIETMMSSSELTEVVIPRVPSISSKDFHKIRNQFETHLNKDVFEVCEVTTNMRVRGDSFTVKLRVIEVE